MSNELAIAAVTTTLHNILRSEISNNGISGFDVSTLPLDKANDENDGKDRLNIFLYQTEVNPAFRNMDISRFKDNSRPPLPLNLHYLITAYGKDRNRVNDHRILGHAMRILHDHTLLSSTELERIFPESQLHQQLEQVRITPQSTSVDEISKLWTTFQTQYRISAAYQVSVVLIDSEDPGASALPVLQRGRKDRGVYVLSDNTPNIHSVKIPNGKPCAEPGDTVILCGNQLNSPGLKVRFQNKFWSEPLDRDPEPESTPTELRVKWPDIDENAFEKNWPAGVYTVSVIVPTPEMPLWSSNEIPIALAPKIKSEKITTTPDPPRIGKFDIKFEFTPQVRKGQIALLIFDGRIYSPQNQISASVSELKFTVLAEKAQIYYLRFRVDGVDSIPVDFSQDSTTFDNKQSVTVIE